MKIVFKALVNLRIFICISIAGVALLIDINRINQLTALSLQIPEIEKEVKKLQRENERLQYEIDRFESPIRLMELVKRPEFGHLKYPVRSEVIQVAK